MARFPISAWPGGPRALTIWLGPWWVVAAMVAAGVVVAVWPGRLLVGGVLVGGSFFLAALLRLVLPEDRAGGLHIRTRPTDVIMYLAMGGAVLVAVVLVLQRYST